MTDLRLAVREEYFHAICSGTKPFEYRLRNEYWRRRIEGKQFKNLVLTLGYPLKNNRNRIYTVTYKGYELQTITHKHFGDDPVDVYAIRIYAK